MNPTFGSEIIELFPRIITAEVERTIAPTRPGRVKFQASHWPARFYQPSHQKTVSPGESVIVIGRAGIDLLVMPINVMFSERLAKPTTASSERQKKLFFGLTEKLGNALSNLLSYE